MLFRVMCSVPFFLYLANPLVVVGHLGVDAKLIQQATFLPPRHQTDQEPGVPVQSDHRATAVPFAGVNSLAEDPGAEDVVGDLVGEHLLAAKGVID